MHKNQTVITLDDKPTENIFKGRFRPSVTQLNYSDLPDLPIVEEKAQPCAEEKETVLEYSEYMQTIREN